MKARYFLFLACVLAPFAAVAAQVPPLPPVTPTPPAVKPVDPVRPFLVPKADWLLTDEVRRQVEEAKAMAHEYKTLLPDRVHMELDARHMAEMAREQSWKVQEQSELFRNQAEIARQGVERARQSGLLNPPHDFNFDFNFDHRFNFDFNHDFNFNFDSFTLPHFNQDLAPPPRPQFYQGDPGDSLYRRAYDVFGKQEYRTAAGRFAEMRTKYPNSRYYCSAIYYEAFSLQRLGLPDDLRNGRKLIEGAASRCSQRSQDQDFLQLGLRINTALAKLGDREADEAVKKMLAAGNVCDAEDRMARAAALSALSQLDPDSTLPMLKSVLAKTDACSASLRMTAIQLASSRRNNPEAVPLLVNSAKNDPAPENRRYAVSALGSISSDAAFAAMEDLFRNSNDEAIQRAAVSAMARSENPRALTTVRTLIERKDVSESVRTSAISSVASQATDLTWLIALYDKMESESLKMAIVNAFPSRNATPDVQAFLVKVAKNQADGSSIRSAALRKVAAFAPLNDLMQIFATADSRSMRQSIVSGISSRREPEATEKLIEIAKSSSDIEVRSQAISALGQSSRKDDPRAKKALCEILGGGPC
jgi:HEAT repeat protein